MAGRRTSKEKEEEAQVSVAVKGSPEDVSKAFESISGGNSTGKEDEIEDRDEQIEKLVADPTNIIIVKRMFPRKFEGKNCAKVVGEFDCPANIEDIRKEVFENFGGKKFRLSIHSDSATGRNKILDAFTITNPDSDDPIFDDEDDEMEGIDPYSIPDDDPERALQEVMKKQVASLQNRIQMKQLQTTIEDLEEKKPDKKEKDNKEENSEIAALKNEILMDRMQRKFDDQLNELKLKMVEAVKPKVDPSQAMLQTMLMQMMEQNNALLTAITNSNKGGGVDSDLDRLAKMKNIMDDGKSRSVLIETALEEVLIKQLNGGKSESEDDPMSFAIKELVPVLKDFATKDRSGDKKEISKEEKEAIYRDAARKTVQEINAQMQEKRRLQLQAARDQIASTPTEEAPLSNPSPIPTPPPQPAPESPHGEGVPYVGPSFPDSIPRAPVSEVIKLEDEGEDMVDLPPAPGTEKYDRKVSVNFVLDSLLHEIEDGVPFQEDSSSEAVTDFLDCLDSELLDKLVNVKESDELETLVKEWAEPSKLESIKKLGEENQLIQIYLRRVVITVQEEHLKAVTKKAGLPSQ